jgi:hypothetical protein
MTLVELTKVLEDGGERISMVVEQREVRRMFPGPDLHPGERESYDDQLSTFCGKHRLSYRLIGNHYLFTRGLPSAIVEHLVKELQGGEPKS